MGLIDRLRKNGSPAEGAGLLRLPSGSFSVDAQGRVLGSTLPRSFPAPLVEELTAVVLEWFRTTRDLQRPMAELGLDFGALRVTARELRGGAIIFLAPRSLGQK